MKFAAILGAALMLGAGAASAAEIGVRQTHGTSWQNNYGGVRVYEADSVTQTNSDLRGGALTLSTNDPTVGAADLAAALATPEAGVIAGTIFSGLVDLEALDATADATLPISAGDPNAPGHIEDPGHIVSAPGTGSGSGEGGAVAGTNLTVQASLVREATQMNSRSQLNESNFFDGGSFSTFSSVSTFAN